VIKVQEDLENSHRLHTSDYLCDDSNSKIEESKINEVGLSFEESSEMIPFSQESKESGLVKFEVFEYFVIQMGFCNFFFILVFVFLMQASSVLYDLWLKSFILGKPLYLIENNFFYTLITLGGIVILFTIFRALTFAFGNLSAS
jgi:hypothetical protein